MFADVALAGERAGPRAWARRLWRGFGDFFESERERWLIWTPALVGLGVAFYFSLRTEPRLSQGILLFGLSLGIAFGLRRFPPAARAMAALAMIAGGFLAAELRTAIVDAPALGAPLGPVAVSGQVAQIELQEKNARIILDSVSIPGLPPAAMPQKVRISLTRYSDIPRLGDRVAIQAKLFPPPAPAAPGAHDFRRDLYFERIGAVGYAVRRYHAAGAVPASDSHLLGRLRQAAAERISAVFAGPDEAARRAIALALLVGERGPIPEPVNNAMRDAGLAHLLAISGMNITIAAGLIYFTLRLGLAAIPWVALRFPIKKWAAAGGLVGEILYTEFVGAPVSAERSMITTGFIMLAIMADRSAITLRLVAISATLLILAEPEAMMGPSFQMSYGAITALVVLYERWRVHAPRDAGVFRRALTYLGGIAVMSIVASAASAVFSIYHFQQSAFYGLGANLLAEPVHDLWIMPWGIASYALMPLGLEALALRPMGWGISAMLWSARLFANLPGAAGHFEAMPVAALALIVIGGLWFLLWTRRWRWLGLGPALAGVALTLTARQPDVLVSADGKLVATRLDSGDLVLSDRRHDRFTQSVWLRRAGEGEAEDHPPPPAMDKSEDCIDGVCRFSVAGHKGAIISFSWSLEAGCKGADIVISRFPAHGQCAAPLVIDVDDLKRDGATSVRFDYGVPTVATVREMTGKRAWTAREP
jgi:competence protein ComEC